MMDSPPRPLFLALGDIIGVMINEGGGKVFDFLGLLILSTNRAISASDHP